MSEVRDTPQKQFFLSCAFKRSSAGFSECRQFWCCGVWSVTALQSQPSTSSRLSAHHIPPSALSSARRDPAFLVPSHTAASPIPKLCWSPSSPFPLTLMSLRCRNSDHAPDSEHGRIKNVTGKGLFVMTTTSFLMSSSILLTCFVST